ncbi:MAG TPA: hypothetical protein VMU48_22165 [Terracidiphilus sp.]|nr:hypothetical protein [Terracidiphilus sp.]
MSSYGNEFTYQKLFHGNLPGLSEEVPVKVHTRLRIMSGEAAREVQELSQLASGVPKYVVGQSKDLPLHPSLQAIGRHYFTW